MSGLTNLDGSSLFGSARQQRRLAVIGLVALCVLIRLPSLLHTAAIDDENIYAVVANAIVDGGRPYVDAIERKPPLLFWVYAAVFAVSGEYNWQALHVTATAWVLLTMGGVYVIARDLFDARAGLFAALLYTIFLPWVTYKNLAFNGEMLMNLPLVWAWALVLGPGRSPAAWRFFASGALVGLGFLLKQPAVIAAVPLAVYPLLPDYRAARRGTVIDSLRQAGLIAVGLGATLGAAVSVLYAQGILGEAYYWTITNHAAPEIFWRRGIAHTAGFIGACLPLVLGAGMALVHPVLWRARRAEWQAIVGWLTVSAIGTAAGGRFYPHYYIQLLPPLVLFAAPTYAVFSRSTASGTAVWLRPHVASLWLTATVAVFAAAHWIGLAPLRASTETGQFLLTHSRTEDRIFVWGQAARIYLDAHRRPASRYVTTFPLTGLIFGPPIVGADTSGRIVPGAWENLREDFSRHPPRYIIDTEVDPAARYPLANFPALSGVVASGYTPVARTSEGVIYERINGVDVANGSGIGHDRP